MARRLYSQLSVREREIMDVIYRRGASNVQEVLDDLQDPPSYSAVRATIGILVEKGHLQRKKDGNRFLYHPVQPARKVRSSVLRHLVKTFFKGSTEEAVAAMIDSSARELDDEQLARLEVLIRKARREGR